MNQDANCLFCKIVSGNIPAKLVKSGDNWVAFSDINPQAPTHILVIPKEHYSALHEVKDANVLGKLFQAAAEVAEDQRLEAGYRLVVNTGADGGQTVFHLHIHLLGGRNMDWPPG